MTRQQQSVWYNMLLDILIRHSLRLHWTLTRHERMWEISGHSIVMDRYFQVSWCPYKYVFLSNLGQKWTFFFSFSVEKLHFVANLVELSGSGSVQSAALCQLQEEGLPAATARLWWRSLLRKILFSLCIKGGGRLKNCKSYHHLKVLNAS